ncbi:MAG TPA: autotransporter assembly complex family protein [Thermoanaerobaculia bacterium]|nr:autotransporter assembly complex family protein [Thermoanaerobaculia bacterium]
MPEPTIRRISRGFSRAACLLACSLLATVAAADTARVDIEGVRGDVRQNVELMIRELELDGDTVLGPIVLQNRVAQLEELTRQALVPFGHYQPTVTVRTSVQGDRHTVQLNVDPGPAVEVAALDLEVAGPGADDPRVVRARQSFPLEVGEPLLHPNWEAGKDALRLAAETSGYLEAVLSEHRIEVDVDRGTADARLSLYTGRQFVFGPLITGQTALSSRLFANYMTFVPGERFSYPVLQELQRALVESGYFERVEVEALPQLEGPLPPLDVPIRITATPARPQKYRLGLGYRTDIGTRASIGVELRRINPRGHRFDAELQVAERQSVIAADYTIPSLERPRTDRLIFEVAYGDDRPQTSQTQTALAGVSLSRQRDPWIDVVGLRYRRDEFEIGPIQDVSDFLILAASRTRVRRDDPIYVRRGSRLLFELAGAERTLISDATFLRALAEGKWILPVGEHGRFIARTGLGYVATSDFPKLPPHLRFFTGGDQSVRGFGYQELGSTNADGIVIGGDSLATASVEYEHRLFEHERLGRWSIAAFVDGGDAFDIDDLPSFGDLHSGAGLGLRWLSPIGLVRADAASAWTEPGNPIRFHLTIGPDL